MKLSIRRRALALLLSLVVAFSLASTAQLSTLPDAGDSGDSGDTGNTGDTGTTTPPTEEISIVLFNGINSVTSDIGLTMNEGDGPTLNATIESPSGTHKDDHIGWVSEDPSIAEPHNSSPNDGHRFYVEGKKPGTTRITGTITDADGRPTGTTFTFPITVSGISPKQTTISIQENQSLHLPDAATDENNAYCITYYGDAAKSAAVSIVSDRRNIVEATGSSRGGLYIDGITAGTAIVTITAGIYSARITVDVVSNEAETIQANASVSEPLKFSTLEAQIAAQCQEMIQADGDKSLVAITGLNVSTAQGTIYLGYQSEENTGAGAGSSLDYYVRTAARGPYIKDLTFVPNASYAGEKATITFTGRAANNRTFKGRIEVTLVDMHTDVILTAQNGDPLKFSAENFAKVCQEQTGSPLSYVIFTLPPASEGVLYRDYKNELDYGSRVTAAERYDRKGLDDITFVPTLGFVGQVTIGYAGYSTTGNRYNGQLIINVTRPLDESIQYQDYGGGEIVFNGSDFDNYSISMTGEAMRTTGRVSFTPPPASQGKLYRSWRNGRGTEVTADDEFSLTQLNSVTFVAADGFDGVVRIPFTGEDRYGATFSGTVELHIQSGTTLNGDIRYTCQPSQSVKLQLTDFANLCQSVTGDRLYYVTFQSLPDYTQGALFYNRTSSGSIGTRVTTASKYFNSAVPYLSNVSFWATANFNSVEIPFTMASVNGQTFTGLLVISGGEGAGGGMAGTVNYTTSGQQPVTFNSADFDAACRQATNSALNYLRFSLPGSGQGILYYDYRTDRAPTALDPSTALYLTGNTAINKVTFVPASGASGVCYIPFTATAINGRSFQGNVAITIRAGAALGSIVYYNTGGAPVYFQTSDLTAASGVGQPTSIRFTGMPGAYQGRVYYQYVSPTQYSWLGNTSTVYSVTGDPAVSNLTFIPKAGYQGVVNIPYVATGADGTTSTGSIEITVTLPSESVSFDDLGSYSAQTRAAIDYLASQGVVNGIAPRRYDPGASIRRGDFCLMLYRAFKFNVGGTGRSFNDVPGDAYYAQAINQMYALGIVNGVGGGLFQPEATITRQDAAVMVRRALDKAGMTVSDGSDQAALANYSDRNRVDTYAQEALGSLVRAGLFPVSGNQLNPKTAITRADMALLLHRAMTNFS